MQRYEVNSSYRKPNGDWCGIIGDPGDAEIWYLIRDTADHLPDWNDADIAGTPYQDECQATCDLLNQLHNKAT